MFSFKFKRKFFIEIMNLIKKYDHRSYDNGLKKKAEVKYEESRIYFLSNYFLTKTFLTSNC